MTTIAIIDYGAGNLLSMARAVTIGGGTPVIARQPEELVGAAGIILPGVGAAGTAMQLLNKGGMAAALRQQVDQGRPTLGVCLGMQLFCDWLAEDDCAGLRFIAGTAAALQPAPAVKVPHMGWNRIEWNAAEGDLPVFSGLQSGIYAYFVHSYYCDTTDEGLVAAWTEHGQRFRAAFVKGPIWGLQFHPEKSGAAGLQMIRNFVAAARQQGASR